MIRLLIVTPSYYPLRGGITIALREISKRLVKRGFDCTVLTMNVSDRQPAKEFIDSVRVIRVNPRFSNYLYGFSPYMYTYLRKRPEVVEQADIVHIQGYHNLLGLETAYLMRDKLLVFNPHYHGVASTWFNNILLKLYKPVGKHIFDYSKKILCVSNSEANLVRRDFNISEERIQVIAPGLHTKPYAPVIRRGVSRDKIRLLFVGHVRKYKGIQYILGAMRTLMDEYNMEPLLEIVGRGDYERVLKSLASKLNIQRQIVWNGNISDAELARKYQTADIFLLLSKAEAYGLVVAEALASGLPCIVANTVALNEFTHEPGCFGIDYPPNPSELATLIQQICSSNIQVGPFTSGKIRTWDEVVNDYEKLYRNL